MCFSYKIHIIKVIFFNSILNWKNKFVVKYIFKNLTNLQIDTLCYILLKNTQIHFEETNTNTNVHRYKIKISILNMFKDIIWDF